MDDAAIGEAVLQDIVLHDFIVTMGINADVMIMPETVVHDTRENTMSIGNAGNTMELTVNEHGYRTEALKK